MDAIDLYKVDIQTAFEFFKLGSQILNDLPTLARVVHEMIEDYDKQNTCYLELRSTPKCFGDKTKVDYVNTILGVIAKADEQIPQIKVRYVLSINRGGPVEQAQDILSLLDEIKSPYIVGVELSGDPRVGNWEDFKDILEKARTQYGMKISLHCAEVTEQ